jgi:hypothetical protein
LTGVKEYRIPLPGYKGYFYSIEYRKPVGIDGIAGIPDGVQVRLHLGRMQNGIDAETLNSNQTFYPGKPFVDPYRNIKVEVLEKLGDRVLLRFGTVY